MNKCEMFLKDFSIFFNENNPNWPEVVFSIDIYTKDIELNLSIENVVTACTDIANINDMITSLPELIEILYTSLVNHEMVALYYES